jgi:hypothetical protein
VNTLRYQLLHELPAERRRVLEGELIALRAARVGVTVPGQLDVLRRWGVSKDGRRPRITRGPAEWGQQVAAHIAPPG